MFTRNKTPVEVKYFKRMLFIPTLLIQKHVDSIQMCIQAVLGTHGGPISYCPLSCLPIWKCFFFFHWYAETKRYSFFVCKNAEKKFCYFNSMLLLLRGVFACIMHIMCLPDFRECTPDILSVQCVFIRQTLKSVLKLSKSLQAQAKPLLCQYSSLPSCSDAYTTFHYPAVAGLGF